METRMQVEDRFMAALQSSLGYARYTDVLRDALTILNWAVRERAKGRVILSADNAGNSQRPRNRPPAFGRAVLRTRVDAAAAQPLRE